MSDIMCVTTVAVCTFQQITYNQKSKHLMNTLQKQLLHILQKYIGMMDGDIEGYPELDDFQVIFLAKMLPKMTWTKEF